MKTAINITNPAIVSKIGERLVGSQKGVALLMALIITMIVFLMVATAMYVVMEGSGISGQRLVYRTACEAADGSVAILKEAIEWKIQEKNQALPLPLQGVLSGTFDNCLNNTVYTDAAVCSNTGFSLPGIAGSYSANVDIVRLFNKAIPGSGITTTRGPQTPGGTSNGVFFRIHTRVLGPRNTSCENTVVYRYVI